MSLTLYSLAGTFTGHVTKLPSRESSAVTFYVSDLEAAGSWQQQTTNAAGDYDPRPQGFVNNWTTPVYGNGGSGTSHRHKFFTLDFKGLEYDSWDGTTTSNTITSFALEVPECNDPEGRCQRTAPPATGPGSAAGKPVNVVSGNVFFDHVDAAIPVIGATLSLTRSYNAAAARLSQGGVFGRGWHTPFDMRVSEPVAKVVRVGERDGLPAYYEDRNQDLVYAASVPITERSYVVKSAAGYVRHLLDGGLETYDTQGLLTSTIDGVGRTTLFARDAAGVLQSVTAPGGRTIGFAYSGGKVVSASGPGGSVLASYEYDSAGMLSKVTYPDGSGYRYTYDGQGQLLAVVDGEGRLVEQHEYDSYGRGLTSVGPDGVEKVTLSYGDNATTVTDALGNVTTYEWKRIEGSPYVTKVTGPCSSCGGSGSGVQEWTYDLLGRVKTYKDGGGHVTSYDYDGSGNLAKKTDALGRETTYTHDSSGRVLTQSDPGGHVTSYVHSAPGPTSIAETVTATQNRTTGIAYNGQGLPQTITDPRGKVTSLAYDANGQLTSVTDPLTHATMFGYDSLGRRTTVTDALNHTTTTAYDSRGRVTTITNHDGTYTSFVYDKSGLRTQVRDPLGRVTFYVYDAAGRLTTVVDPMNGATRYGYDLMSRLTSLTDAKQQTTAFEYDGNGRAKKVIYPGGASETFTYDVDGRLATKTDRKDVTTTYSYDVLDRLTGKTYSDGTTPAVGYTYNTSGQLATAANGTDTLTWTYDLPGQLLSEQSTKNSSTVAYTYDDAGNRLTVSLDGTLFVSYAYDDASRLTTITRGTNVFGFSYDNANRRTLMTYPNGLNTSYSYDNLNRLLNLSAVHTPTSSTITNFTYTYDAAGNRLTKALPDYTETYKYDALYRLTQAERTGSLTGMQTWSYDPVGNRLTNQKDAAVITNSYNEKNQLISSTGGGLMLWRGSLDEPGTVTFTSALVNGRPARMVPGNVFETLLPMNVGSNTVTLEARDTTGNLRTKSYSVDVTGDGATYTNDANGNLSQKVAGADTWVYTWDAENRLKRVENNGVEVASFEYDAIGRRVEKLDGGVTTTFSYDGPGIIRLGVGSTITTYVHDLGIDKPLRAEDGTGTLSFVNADGLGSAVSSANAAGEVTSTARYDAWGNIEAGAANRYGFTGREPDQTGLAYYRARYYDPKIGRFISEDPIGFKGGLNLYRYVENKPNDRVDPFGLESGNINQMVPGPGNTPMFPWPTPCKPSSCMQRCLARIFGTLPPITVMPNAAGVAPALGYAISGYRSIDLPVSCDTFYGEPDWVLHEYYHVLQQWERGPTLFGARYVAQAVAHGFQHDRIPAEQQAEAFAQMLSGALERCLESCKCN